MMGQKYPEKEWKFSRMVYGEMLDELERHFSKLHIPYMPIKGAYLICSGLAGKMRNRRMDDIDILIEESRFKAATEYFFNLDNVTKNKNYWPFESSFFYSMGDFSAFVEIHYQLNYPQRFNLPAQQLFSRGIASGKSMVLPSPEDALLIVLCHALVHIPFEIRSTIFDEISIISGQEKFSWEKFWELAKGTGIKRFISLLLGLYEKKTGSVVPVGSGFALKPLLQLLLSGPAYRRMPPYLRRMFFEIPFVKDPVWLVRQKFIQIQK